jgi:hypothetical protein
MLRDWWDSSAGLFGCFGFFIVLLCVAMWIMFSEACLLVLLERFVCRFQHGRLLLCERSVLGGARAPTAFPFTLRIGKCRPL